MQVYTERVGGEIVLFAVPEKRDSFCNIKDFARVGEPLKAVLRSERGTKQPYLEVRKEAQ